MAFNPLNIEKAKNQFASSIYPKNPYRISCQFD